MWETIIINVNEKKFTAYVKHYETPSQYGIDGGCISKLMIKDNTQDDKIVVNYDRGWDIKPETPEAAAAYETVLRAFN